MNFELPNKDNTVINSDFVFREGSRNFAPFGNPSYVKDNPWMRGCDVYILFYHRRFLNMKDEDMYTLPLAVDIANQCGPNFIFMWGRIWEKIRGGGDVERGKKWKDVTDNLMMTTSDYIQSIEDQRISEANPGRI